MSVVVRGLMAAGMAVFAAMHVLQVLDPPSGTPAWLTIGFAGVALAGALLAVLLIVASPETVGRWQVAAASLAAVSAVALLLALTVGLFGVVEVGLRYEVVLSIVAEIVVLGAFAASRLVPTEADQQVDGAGRPLVEP